jgi:hypothetical protein
VGKVLQFKPDIRFKQFEAFQTGDQFNKHRGTWFYRGDGSNVHGPFHGEMTAHIHMVESYGEKFAPMRTPFEKGDSWWWRKETPHGEQVLGPYQFKAQAETAIANHIQQLKDKAGHDRYR